MFPALANLWSESQEAAFHLPAGSATFGRSVVDFERHIQIYTVQAAYGLTDRLSIGVRIPYWTQDIRVKAALDTRTATVGFNPAVPGGVAPLGVQGRGRQRPRISSGS